jgi:hypothetical protein
LTARNVKDNLGAQEGRVVETGDYLTWAGVGSVAALSLTMFVLALKRRLERGQPARFSIGLGLVDVIEGLTGKELSPRSQMRIFLFSIALGVSLAAAGIGVIIYLGASR